MTTAPHNEAYPSCNTDDTTELITRQDQARESIPRDQLTYRLLSLCAETDAITWTSDTQRPLLRGLAVSNSVCWWLTTLTALNLIAWYDDLAWYDDRNATGVQYAEETPAGRELLRRWDTELLGGAE